MKISWAMRFVVAIFVIVCMQSQTYAVEHELDFVELDEKLVSEAWISEGGTTEVVSHRWKACQLRTVSETGVQFKLMRTKGALSPEVTLEPWNWDDTRDPTTRIGLSFDNGPNINVVAYYLGKALFLEWPDTPDLLNAIAASKQLSISVREIVVPINLSGAAAAIEAHRSCLEKLRTPQ